MPSSAALAVNLRALESAVNALLSNPDFHAPLALLKGVRNGIVYGTKIRFPHALVMALLFRPGPLSTKLSLVFKATRTHARNLGSFVFIYKLLTYMLRYFRGGGKEESLDSFLAGLVGGYVVFGRGKKGKSSVNQQIVMYVFARVVLGGVKLGFAGVQEKGVIKEGMGKRIQGAAWPVFAAVSWACVMWLFRWHPEVLQGSLRSSMVYLYDNSERWEGWRNWMWHNR